MILNLRIKSVLKPDFAVDERSFIWHSHRHLPVWEPLLGDGKLPNRTPNVVSAGHMSRRPGMPCIQTLLQNLIGGRWLGDAIRGSY